MDRKLSPVEELADTEFRAQLDPQGVAKYSDMYRNPSKYTGVAYYKKPSQYGGFYMDTPTATSETLWGRDTKERQALEPEQTFWRGKSYITPTGMFKGIPTDIWLHEAYHDASTAAAGSEFMDPEAQKAYYALNDTKLEDLGVSLEEALAKYDQSLHASTERYRSEALDQLETMRNAASVRLNDDIWAMWREDNPELVKSFRVWREQLKTENLATMYRHVLQAAKKRHEALGYR